MAFRGKNAVVTGGSSGIGLEVVKQLLDHGAARVAIIDVVENLEEFCKMRTQHPNQSMIFVRQDVSNKNGLEKTYEEIIKNFKCLDMVINIAGIFDDKDVKRTIDVNVGGIINSTFTGMHYMSKENGGNGGVICNMSSVVALDPMFLLPVYCSTKHAVLGFTRALASDYFFQKTGIKFCVICPGATITQLFTNTPNKLFSADLEKESYRLLEQMPKQSSADCARGLLEALQKSENGSVWIIEQKKLHPVKMHKYWDNISNKLA